MSVSGLGPKTRGATAVEFALVVPVFLLILLFMVDAGRMLFVQASIQDAAHQGARASAIGATTTEVVQLTQDLAAAAIAMAASTQTEVDVNILLECPNPYDAAALDRTTVQTSLEFSFFTPIGLIQQFDPGSTRPGTVTLTQEAQWLCEG